jgi:hypothetical protein
MAVTLNASTSSGLVQTADTSGTVEIQSNGTTRLTVASGGVTTTGNTSIANLTATGTFGGGVITSGTAVNAATGSPTSIDFTGIPSWVKRISVMFAGVSGSGTSSVLVQVGISTGVVTSGYVSTSVSSGGGTTASTAGFSMQNATASNTLSGIMTIILFDTNAWASSHSAKTSTTITINGGGNVTNIGGTLDRVRITTVNGTDTFDAGTINILYEG